MYIWLSNQIGTSAANITTSVVFFIITITALATIILFVRRLNTGRFSINKKKHLSRLTLCDTLSIDRARRLILVRCDDKEHLLLIGGLTDVVVESNITTTSMIQKKETQPTLTTTEINPDLTEKISFSRNERKHTQNTSPSSFMKQNVEDSAITAEIEGRQEPSLFIPAAKK
ncbi:flagellar biosynthetic protein FliO [Bartonella taylorii]|uniref:Flagellar biosynthetic protein FliO n=1 Tax=Bartonella taylorii TaxID=33046 RepID=A0A9Q8YZQ8_BARTA|nr:flagellar biosynthetic protein FliO [Bartonella taylorii]OPB35565.1 Flagellar biosynthesis protein, FliO [Bartonella taylorii]USP03210.1 flagellar biosynthetic protein FliO [Bartonella taylorii]